MKVPGPSRSVEWATPLAVFETIAAAFGPFDVDAAATEANAKAPVFFTRESSGLRSTNPWVGRVWVNPPFGDAIADGAPGIADWLVRAWHETGPHGRADRVVLLVPAHTGSAWFHDYVLGGRFPSRKPRAIFLRDRIAFENADGTKERAPFGCALAVFDRDESVLPESEGDLGRVVAEFSNEEGEPILGWATPFEKVLAGAEA